MFSIVIPVFNRAHIVKDTLDSIARQSYRPIHLILVDNNSTDDSLKVMTEWKAGNESDDLKVTITSEHTPGAAAARNKGLSLVETPYMAFFDSDDTMRENCVKEYMKLFTRQPDTDIICSNSMLHFTDGKCRLLKFRRGNTLHNHIYHATLRTQGYAVSTAFMRKAGGWINHILAWDDWELGVRLLLNRPKLVVSNKTLVDIYMQEQSITGTDFSSKAGEWEHALDMAEQAICNSDYPDKHKIIRRIDYRRVVLAAHYRKEGKREISDRLHQSVIARYHNNPAMRLSMLFTFHYTAAGGRGAATLIEHLI